MSVYFVKKKGWRYDFTLKGARFTNQWFKTKIEARQAEAKRREEITNPELNQPQIEKTKTDMDFINLINKRLDHVKKYNSQSHYDDVRYHARRWLKEWDGMKCNDITTDMIESYIFKRSNVSNFVGNKELQYLRALFNYGKKKKFVETNPTDDLSYFPVEKSDRYVPPEKDVYKVISVADPDTQDYIWSILLTAARVNEINNLEWKDVDFENATVTLWTRKTKNGNLENRKVPMIEKLRDILQRRYNDRNSDMPWVFWHTYWSRKQGKHLSGPYGDRKKIMTTLCKKAGVKYFRYHPLRHLTASILDNMGVAIGVIQRILGHKNRRTTEIYLHSISEAERDAMNLLESLDLFSTKATESQANVLNNSPTNVHKEFWHRKAERPSHDILKQEILTLGYSRTGKKYGVSGNAVKKWVRFYEKEAKVLN